MEISRRRNDDRRCRGHLELVDKKKRRRGKEEEGSLSKLKVERDPIQKERFRRTENREGPVAELVICLRGIGDNFSNS